MFIRPKITIIATRCHPIGLRRITTNVDHHSVDVPTTRVFGLKTVTSGERAAIFRPNGKVELVEGPKRLWLFGSYLRPLKQSTADPTQYIEIKKRDGQTQVIPGPASVWEDPVEHVQVNVNSATTVNSNECVVVYNEDNGAIHRHIVKGPKLHIPKAKEWYHWFKWHGAHPANPEKKLSGALTFTKLRTIPDQMYYDVENVRTADDALIVVKLMIFFELKDVDKMLDTTHDPVADFINGASADVIDFTSMHKFEPFKQSIDKLNLLETYPQLCERAEKIGYKIHKVVFRGYTASRTLQDMHNNAIEARTKLHLERETEEQAQSLQDFKITKEKERTEQRLRMQEMEVSHKAKMDKLMHEEKMRQTNAQKQSELEHKEKLANLEQKQQEETNNLQKDYVQNLKNMGVDLTQFLVAQAQGKPNQWIKVESPSSGGSVSPHLHLPADK